MTIIEAINKIDEMKPNSYTQSDKVRWLSILDGIIKRNVIDTHECDEEIEFDGYDDDTSVDTELLIKAPYDDIYIFWMESRIDYANSEYAKYNNSVTRYNDTYKAFFSDYNRSHMPIRQNFKFF